MPGGHTKGGLWPAFPGQARDAQGNPIAEYADGLTKREYFAAMALQGWLAGCQNAYSEFTGKAKYAATAAECSVKFADALIKALTDDGVTK